MKKVLLVLTAMLTLVFTGCKIENSNVTVSVEDTEGYPVANRGIFYSDLASIIIGELVPSPEELATGVSDVWEYAVTNRQGTVVIRIPLGVSKMKYEFLVWDEGAQQWITKEVELHRGENEEIRFVVNR